MRCEMSCKIQKKGTDMRCEMSCKIEQRSTIPVTDGKKKPICRQEEKACSIGVSRMGFRYCSLKVWVGLVSYEGRDSSTIVNSIRSSS